MIARRLPGELEVTRVEDRGRRSAPYALVVEAWTLDGAALDVAAVHGGPSATARAAP